MVEAQAWWRSILVLHDGSGHGEVLSIWRSPTFNVKHASRYGRSGPARIAASYSKSDTYSTARRNRTVPREPSVDASHPPSNTASYCLFKPTTTGTIRQPTLAHIRRKETGYPRWRLEARNITWNRWRARTDRPRAIENAT